jgi:hypothetical protein
MGSSTEIAVLRRFFGSSGKLQQFSQGDNRKKVAHAPQAGTAFPVTSA